MANYEVAELTWENGQLAMHELGGMFSPTASTLSSLPKPTWGAGAGDGGGRAGDTLESIVHQATCCNKINPNSMPTSTTQVVMGHNNMDNVAPVVAPSGGKRAVNSGTMQPAPPPPPPSRLVKKRMREPNDRESACASASASASANAVFCGENNDTTMITWASHESPRSCTRTKTTTDEDSACHGGSENQEEGREIKSERGRSYTTRKGRAAAIHNQSERRRRDRINQKMKALQKLVPNASKTDKASMLDEVIDYLKQLQAQVQMMSNARFMPQIMMPLGMQQHLHMSLLARMGMGMGMGTGIGMGMGMGIGMLDTPQAPVPLLIQPTQVATAASGFVPPAAFVVPQMVPTAVTQQPGPDQGASTSGSSQDPYSTLLAQSMNIDLYNRMAALQRQQQQQQMIAQPASTQLQLNHQHVQGS